jgi:DNA-directed RNA polymerase specialized sigma24 family protein
MQIKLLYALVFLLLNYLIIFPESPALPIRIVATYKNLVFNTALGMVDDREDADDITKEVFVTVYRNTHNFKGESRLSTWIDRIAVTKALDLLREKTRKRRLALAAGIFGFGVGGSNPSTPALGRGQL